MTRFWIINDSGIWRKYIAINATDGSALVIETGIKGSGPIGPV